MRRTAIVTTSAVVLASVLLSVAVNLATGTVPDRWRPWLWLSWPAVALLGVVAVVLEVRRARPEPMWPSTDAVDGEARLHLAARALAKAVRAQWAQESSVRGLRRPEPLRVRWSAVSAAFTADPSVVLDDATLRGSPTRLRARGDVLDTAARFRQLRRGQLVVLGAAGSGKSVLAMLLTLGLLERPSADDPVPFLVSLSSWQPNTEHLFTWLARRLSAEYSFLGDVPTYGPDAALRLVTDDRVIPVLDGLDEMPAELHPTAIDHLDRAAGDRPLVLTCRWDEYRAAVDRAGHLMSKAAVIRLDPVGLDDAEAFLAVSSPSRAQWRAVLAELRDHPDLPLARALSSPLMVGLARAVYAHSGSDPAELLDGDRFPDRQSIERCLLNAFIPAMYTHYPVLSDSQPVATARTRYEKDLAHRWLTFLARHLHRLATHDLAWWQLHRVLPRLGLACLAGLACAALAGPLIGLIAGLVFGSHYLPVAGLATALGIGPGAALVVGLRRGPSPSRILFDLRGRGGQVRRALTIGLGAGPLAGITFGLVFWVVVPGGLGVGLVAGLVAGAVGGLGVGAMAALRAPIEATRVVDPMSLLRADRTAALLQAGAGGLAAAFGAGLIAALIARPEVRAGVAVVAGLGVGWGVALVATCTTAWGQWTLTRLWSALRKYTPWHLMDFLDDAHRRGVLRQNGGVYQFRHALLQAHLLSQSSSVSMLDSLRSSSVDLGARDD
jgi:hypothetical protein